MADNKVTIEFEVLGNAVKKLDEITKSVGDLQSSVKKDSANLGNSFDSAFSLFTKGAALTGAIYATKKALDVLFEAENVKSINAQFELFTKNAKVGTETLREGLIKAADGLADDTDLLKVANKALIDLGISAAKLPEILGLARQVTASFGGGLIENFEKLSNAIATGQVKTLKQMGLIIDLDKAHKDYAATLGVNVSKLSDTAKQTALLNAVLEKGKTSFNGLDTDANQVQNAFQRLKVTLAQAAETATLAFDKLAGSSVASGLNATNTVLGNISNTLKANLGDGAARANIQIDSLTKGLDSLYAAQARGQGQSSLSDSFSSVDEDIKKVREELNLLEESQRKHSTQNREMAESAKLVQEEENKKAQALEVSRIKSEEAAEKEKKLVEERRKAEEESIKASFEAKQGLLDSQHELETISDEAYYAQKTQVENDRFTAELAKQQDQLLKKQVSETTYLRNVQTATENHEKKINEIQSKSNKQKLTDQQNFLSTAATLQNAKTKELQIIGKAAAITSIAIQTPPAIGGAIRFGNEIGGPAVGAVFAAITAAAMAAQAAQIAGVPLATGIDSVPGTGNKDNFPAILMPGERVVPTTTNKDLTAFLSGSGTIAQTLQSIDNKLSQLQNSTIVNIGSKNIVNELRDAMAGGRVINV